MEGTHKQRPFRVLALDGGGIRGLYSASILNTLNRRFAAMRRVEGLDIGAGFDLITGTSTGGIIACALANGQPTQQIVDFYRDIGPMIFTDPMPLMGWSFWIWAFRNRRKAANHPHALQAALKRFFGEETLGGLYSSRGIALCIPATHLGRNRGWVFKTPHNEHLTRDQGFGLVDVCLATSAAPVYLPLHAIVDNEDASRHHVFCDGGLWTNNPILVGLIEALDLSAPEQSIEIVSIGTCDTGMVKDIGKDHVDRGLLDWRGFADALLTSLDAQSRGMHDMANLLSRHLTKLGKHITILRPDQSAPSPERAKHWGLDSVHQPTIKALTELAQQDAEMYFSAAQSGAPQYAMLASIFKSLPEQMN